MGFASRELDIIFNFFHEEQFDVDVVFETSKVPHDDLDVGIFLGYGVDEDGPIEEFSVLRTSTPLEKGDRLVYIPPTPEAGDRKVKERVMGEGDAYEGSDTYIGDIATFPGGSTKGITKRLLFRSPNGVASLEIPDTPSPFETPYEYDASMLFEIGGKPPGLGLKIATTGDQFRLYDTAPQVINIEPQDVDSWLRKKKATLKIIYENTDIHIEDIQVESEELSLYGRVIKGVKPFPYQSGEITIEVEWVFDSDYEQELAEEASSLYLDITFWDLKMGSIKYNLQKNLRVGFGEGYKEHLPILLVPEIALVPMMVESRVHSYKLVPSGYDLDNSDDVYSIIPKEIQMDMNDRVIMKAPLSLITMDRVGTISTSVGKPPYTQIGGVGTSNPAIVSVALNREQELEAILSYGDAGIKGAQIIFSGVASWI